MTSPGPRNGFGLVSFIGAGPGDPDRSTFKGLRRRREADVVLHDRLVPVVLTGPDHTGGLTFVFYMAVREPEPSRHPGRARR